MTIIILKNGTTSINIQCAGLTYLEYCEDDNIYKCEYSDWAFGLFAMLAVVALLVPIVTIIHCGIKMYHQRVNENFKPNISRQTSYSSIKSLQDEQESSSHDVWLLLFLMCSFNSSNEFEFANKINSKIKHYY